MNIIEINLKRMEKQLTEWAAKLERLSNEIESTTAPIKTSYRLHLIELKLKQRSTRLKLEEFKGSGSEKWGAFKDGIKDVWRELEVSLRELPES